MTISTTQSNAIIAGTSAAFTFSFSFIADQASDISVYYIDAAGNQTLLSPTQYTLTINSAPPNQLWGSGGNVTYPLSGSPIATGTYLQIQRTLPLTQETSVQNQGNYYAQVTEQALDILEMQIQQLAARTGQLRGIWASGVQYNFGDVVVDGVNGNNTGNYYMCVIANLSSVWATELAAGDWSLSINTQQIAAYAATAAAGAATATTEAGIATSAATTATTGATTATTQAGIATSAATTATTQAGIATSAATTATTGATTATAQAVIATNQATISTTQAGISTTQAGISTTEANIATAAAVAAGSTLSSTSVTSNTIGTGNFTFTTQANKNYQMGQPIIAASAANGANYIHGYVNSYSGTTLIITETDLGGAGAHADWNISVAGTQGPSGGGTGTVTTVSVVPANGLAGTIANPTTTPAITLSTSITGVLKGNGTAISAATAGTDYSSGTSSNTTGLVKSTTGTGALTTAVSGTDYSAGTASNATGIVKSTTGTGALTTAAAGTDYSAGTAANTTGLVKSTTATGALTTAVAGTDYQAPISLTTTGTSGAATFTSNTLNVPQYSSGAMVLLSSQTISSSTAAVSVTSGINNTYSHYIWEISDLLPVSSSTQVLITFQQGGVFVSSGYYYYGFNESNSTLNAVFNNNSSSLSSLAAIFYNVNPGFLRIEFWQPASSSPLSVLAEFIAPNTTSTIAASYERVGGILNTSAVTTGIKLAFSSGNIATCTANLYGIT